MSIPHSPTIRVPDRFALSAEDYLRQSGLDIYLQDVVHTILNERHEQPLLNIHQYFSKVVDSQQNQGREFDFVDATSRNRLAFVRTFATSFANFKPEEMLVGEDIHQLLSMICPDFPMYIVRSSLATFTQRQLPFTTISTSVSIYFFYRQFIELVERIFTSASNPLEATTPTRVRNYTLHFNKNTVLSVLIHLFYNDQDGISANHYRAQKMAENEQNDEGVEDVDSVGGANDARFQHVAQNMLDSHEIKHVGLCVPPFWSVQQAAEQASRATSTAINSIDVCTGVGAGAVSDASNSTDTGTDTSSDKNDMAASTTEKRNISWFHFLRFFLSNINLQRQLVDVSLEPPECMISTSAVVAEHEAQPYSLMRAMVSADIKVASSATATTDNSSVQAQDASGRRKKRGKSAGRRRS
jgi:hypothetical protein